jgi:hypothetical protein
MKNVMTRRDEADQSVVRVDQSADLPRQKRTASRGIAMAAVCGLVLLIASSLGACGNLPSTDGSADTTTITGVETTSTTEAPETITVESIELDASLMEDPETLAETILADRITQWINAGATLEDYNEATLSSVDIDSAAQSTASQYDPIFKEALFTEETTNSALDGWVSLVERSHTGTVLNNFMTNDNANFTQDKEPYRLWMEVSAVESVERNSDGSVRTNCVWNADD